MLYNVLNHLPPFLRRFLMSKVVYGPCDYHDGYTVNPKTKVCHVCRYDYTGIQD